MHPHLEHISLHANLVAELIQYAVVIPLDSPPNPLRELQHPVFLLLRELRPEPFAPHHHRRRPARPASGSHVSVSSLRRLRASIVSFGIVFVILILMVSLINGSHQMMMMVVVVIAVISVILITARGHITRLKQRQCGGAIIIHNVLVPSRSGGPRVVHHHL